MQNEEIEEFLTLGNVALELFIFECKVRFANECEPLNS
jgi:hypothetical protein